MSSLPTPEEIRLLRKRAGLTQKELATRAGVSQSLIARIEGGSVDPRLSTLRKILTVIEEALEKHSKAHHVMHTPVITLSPNDNLEKAAKIMWKYGISQIPVVDEKKRVIGTVYEDTVIKKILSLKNAEQVFRMRVESVLEDPLPVVSPDDPIDKVLRILLSGVPAVIVTDKGQPVGIITKSDVIALYLHRSSSRK
ncbi:MAG: CBS domain-containing protein [Thermoproteales archaeon]|nr:CBS domain-containing protein [Thermoproteales archaeon]